MEVYIDNIQIQMLTGKLTIEGSFDFISRTASFSYVYDNDNPEYAQYKAQIGSLVVIKENGKGVFQGTVCDINYISNTKLISIRAKDLLSLLLKEKLLGRYKGTIQTVAANLLGQFKINFSYLKSDTSINILSFENLSAVDILMIALKKIFKTKFKIYLDGDNVLRVLTPSISDCAGDFRIGENIISSSFSINDNTGMKKLSKITAFGSNNVVSGNVIRITEPISAISGYFTVIRDFHSYYPIHTMNLELESLESL